MNEAIYRFFADDHRRLDALLEAATRVSDEVDLDPFGAFRGGLLKHIGMEEKLLFPALRAALGERAAHVTAKLRVDHGALVALLVPTPTPAIVDEIRSILVPHNAREEEPAGVYDLCGALDSAAAEGLLARVRAFPAVPVNPYNDGPEVMKHVAATVDLARKQWLEGERRGV
jgi:hypothetical protein